MMVEPDKQNLELHQVPSKTGIVMGPMAVGCNLGASDKKILTIIRVKKAEMRDQQRWLLLVSAHRVFIPTRTAPEALSRVEIRRILLV